MKTQQQSCMHTTYKVSICSTFLCFHISFYLYLVLNCLILSGRSVLHYTILHTLAPTSLLLNMAVVTNLFLHYIPNVLYGIDFWPNPWLFQNGYFVTFKECSILLDLWNGVRSCIKIYPFCWSTTHSHYSSLYFTVITIDALSCLVL